MPRSTPGGTDSAPLDGFTLGGLVLTAVVMTAYVVLHWYRHRDWPDAGVIALLGLTTTGIIGGVRLCIVPITSADLGPFGMEDRLLIPVAGVTLFYVAARALVDILRNGSDARTRR